MDDEEIEDVVNDDQFSKAQQIKTDKEKEEIRLKRQLIALHERSARAVDDRKRTSYKGQQQIETKLSSKTPSYSVQESINDNRTPTIIG